MKVAITGASGHIGSCLTRELINRGDKVKVLVHNSNLSIQELNIEIVKGDLNNKKSLEILCSDVDVVFHLAAKIAIDKSERELVYKTNVEGTQNLIDVCISKNVPRFIHFSSIHAYDPHPLDEVLDETRDYIGKTKLIYEKSKAESERIVLNSVSKGLNALVLNPTAVVGPYDFQGSYLGQALIKIYQNKLPMLVPGGYDWVDVRDVVDGSVNAITKGRIGEKYILSGHYLSLKELSELIGKIGNKKTPKLLAPLFLAKVGLPFIKLYSKITKDHPLYTSESLHILKNSNKIISNKKAQKELNYNPRPFNETLKSAFDWYIENGVINQ